LGNGKVCKALNLNGRSENLEITSLKTKNPTIVKIDQSEFMINL